MLKLGKGLIRRIFRIRATHHISCGVMFIDLVLGLVCAMSFLPLITGYCAYSYGRSFWVWFALGWVLPLVSFFILFALIARRQLNPATRLLDEAKEILARAEAKVK